MGKSPSHFDGKPIGTPMDAKDAFHAGVTTGPDQVERIEELRRLRNKLWKAERKAQRQARYAAQTPEEREASFQAYKRRRNRADNMLKALRNGKPVNAVAGYWRVTPDEVLAEVKWLTTHRNRNKGLRHNKPKEARGMLPERKLAAPSAAPPQEGER